MDPFWAVARVQAQRESFAAGHLQTRGYEVFVPKIELRRTVEPLFRGHCFVVIWDRWRAVERTFGVLSLIKFGDVPARCPDAEIAALRARADPITGLIKLAPQAPPRAFRRGDKVKILAGQFAHFDAIHTGMSARARELVLISLLGSTHQVAVAPHLVEKVRPGASDAHQMARRGRRT
jgi:transcriptional antiterminator RfaH